MGVFRQENIHFSILMLYFDRIPTHVIGFRSMRLELKTPASFQDKLVPKGTRLAGWAALVHAFGLQSPVRKPSSVSEKQVRGSRREEGGFRVFVFIRGQTTILNLLAG